MVRIFKFRGSNACAFTQLRGTRAVCRCKLNEPQGETRRNRGLNHEPVRLSRTDKTLQRVSMFIPKGHKDNAHGKNEDSHVR